MRIDFVGRVRNTHLPHTKALLPIFEAVVNSLYAIEEAEIKNGKITVVIERDESQLELPSLSYETRSIKTVEIIDNGIGFTEDNYQSFLTSDTTQKASRGAKGIGRFLWLKAFEKVEIRSIFNENNSYYRRHFDFVLKDEGVIHDTYEKLTTSQERQTRVTLINFEPSYQAHCPKSLEVIALRIIEHVLSWFLYDKQPDIEVRDDKQTIDLNQLFSEQIRKTSSCNKFSIKSEKFRIDHLRIYSGETHKHQVHYCANNREVTHRDLGHAIPDLVSKLKDEEGRSFAYLGYVSGSFLDERVIPERTDFDILETSDLEFPNEITKEHITNRILPYIEQYLSDYLTPIREKKREKVERYILSSSPQFRPLLRHKAEFLDSLPPNLEGSKLHIKLYEVYYKAELEIRQTLQKLVDQEDDDENLEEFREKFMQYIEEINDFGKSNLAQYIVHRKLILDLFAKCLKINQDNKRYSLEESIHNIIFPLKSTSDETLYERQNLWMIDEKLSYHRYLASDKELKTLVPLENESRERPDLIIFNSPFSFVEGDSPYSSIVIIEFKRPGRKAYVDEDDPIQQVLRYVDRIREGKIVDKHGRPVIVPKTLPFYAYILCDLIPKIQKFADRNNMTPAPDSLGFFTYNDRLKTYIEIISYEKLLSDARKRNQILFEKLSLPV